MKILSLQDRVPGSKPYLNAVVMGHLASGKSTVAGRLVYECDGIDEELMSKFEKEANEVINTQENEKLY